MKTKPFVILRILITALISIQATSSCAFAEEKKAPAPIKTENELYYWMQYYYRNPRPELSG
ncbi:MAG: hypothetical protein WCY34_06970, partial [Candidatus Omnitrophota bacterium]